MKHEGELSRISVAVCLSLRSVAKFMPVSQCYLAHVCASNVSVLLTYIYIYISNEHSRVFINVVLGDQIVQCVYIVRSEFLCVHVNHVDSALLLLLPSASHHPASSATPPPRGWPQEGQHVGPSLTFIWDSSSEGTHLFF